MGCYVWYKYNAEGPGRAVALPSRLLAAPNVTARPSTASVPTSYYSMWHYNYHCTLKGRVTLVQPVLSAIMRFGHSTADLLQPCIFHQLSLMVDRYKNLAGIYFADAVNWDELYCSRRRIDQTQVCRSSKCQAGATVCAL